MSSTTYDLNELTGQDYFEFTLDEFKYRMKYPTTNEIVELNEVAKNGDDWEKDAAALEDKVKAATGDKKLQLQDHLDKLNEKIKLSQESFVDWCMKYITPDTPDAPNVKETLVNKNMKFLLAFIKMVSTEFNES